MWPRVCTLCIFPSNYMEWYSPPSSSPPSLCGRTLTSVHMPTVCYRQTLALLRKARKKSGLSLFDRLLPRMRLHRPGLVPRLLSRMRLRRPGLVPRLLSRMRLHRPGLVPRLLPRMRLRRPDLVPRLLSRMRLHRPGLVPRLLSRMRLCRPWPRT